MKLSVVVPIMNELATLPQFIETVDAEIRDLVNDYEIIFVDGLSTDGSFELIGEFNQKDNRIRCVRMSRRFKIDECIMAGMQYVSGDLITILYADLQDHPKYLKKMLDLLEANQADVVYGVRNRVVGENPFNLFVKLQCYKLINIMAEIHMPIKSGDFMLMRKRVVDVVVQNNEFNPYFRGLVRLAGFKQLPMSYDKQPRLAGNSKIQMFSLREIAYFIYALTSVTFVPIYMVFVLGFVGALIGLSMIFKGMFFPSEDFAKLLSIGFFFWGSILMSLGVLGIYIIRIYKDVRGRQRHIVSQLIGL